MKPTPALFGAIFFDPSMGRSLICPKIIMSVETTSCELDMIPDKIQTTKKVVKIIYDLFGEIEERGGEYWTDVHDLDMAEVFGLSLSRQIINTFAVPSYREYFNDREPWRTKTVFTFKYRDIKSVWYMDEFLYLVNENIDDFERWWVEAPLHPTQSFVTYLKNQLQ